MREEEREGKRKKAEGKTVKRNTAVCHQLQLAKYIGRKSESLKKKKKSTGTVRNRECIHSTINKL